MTTFKLKCRLVQSEKGLLRVRRWLAALQMCASCEGISGQFTPGAGSGEECSGISSADENILETSAYLHLDEFLALCCLCCRLKI